MEDETLKKYQLYLSLNTIESSEPENLPAAKLSLGVVNLLLILSKVFIHDLVTPCPMTSLLQELQLTSGHRGNDL